VCTSVISSPYGDLFDGVFPNDALCFCAEARG